MRNIQIVCDSCGREMGPIEGKLFPDGMVSVDVIDASNHTSLVPRRPDSFTLKVFGREVTVVRKPPPSPP